jgi:hypothetical protein|tara:strand:+ start:227 stop:370 length:144 start_codon:yes stop_codon:yes gene_type:complete
MNKLTLFHVLLMALGFLPAFILGLQFIFLFFSLFVCAAVTVADKILA